jgi:hypothetical protein
MGVRGQAEQRAGGRGRSAPCSSPHLELQPAPNGLSATACLGTGPALFALRDGCKLEGPWEKCARDRLESLGSNSLAAPAHVSLREIFLCVLAPGLYHS